MSETRAATKLDRRMVEKVWGRHRLDAPFDVSSEAPIGEVWFEPPPFADGLLAKYIFTSEKLSVQLHPTDAQARASGAGPRGKEECWYIISAQPGAQLAIGFREETDAQTIRRAALDGSIETLMNWYDVAPGDFFYIPANTVHAIGAGVGLVEIQQNSDITYRLYDYGRPRELHLDAAVPIADGAPLPAKHQRAVPAQGECWLSEGPKFSLLRYDGPPGEAARARLAKQDCLLLPLLGSVEIDGEQIAPGEAAMIAQLDTLYVPGAARGFIAVPGSV